jgi:hypothetical protein
MARRFQRLKNSLKLHTPESGNLTVSTAAPIYPYFQYERNGRVRTEDEQVIQPPRGKADKISINPFGYGDAQKALVRVTGRSKTAVEDTSGEASLPLGRTDFNWNANTDDAINIGGFKPAKAIITKLKDGPEPGTDGTYADNAWDDYTFTSFYTGWKYRSLADKSFTIPFGKASSGAVEEIDVQEEIIQKLLDEDDNYSYTFTPERKSRRIY